MASSDEKQTSLPIERPKYSLISRIRAIFSRASQESEIDKIADQISIGQEGIEMSDKKMPVYREMHRSRYTAATKNIDYEATYTDVKGNEKSFSIKRERYSISPAYIFTQEGVPIEVAHKYENRTSDEYHPTTVDVSQEYIDLLEYASFINEGTGNRAFVDEMGRLIEEIAEGYSVPQTYNSEDAGKQLDKRLKKSPIYRQMEKSYKRAFEEYIETAKDFYKGHEEKEDGNSRRSEFLNGLKVEENDENKQAEEKRKDNEISKETQDERNEAANDIEEER